MFRIGQKVVCIEDVVWDIDGCGPQENEVCMVSGFDSDGWLEFEEYPKEDYYNPAYFRPLDDDWAHEVLENVLSEIKENELVEAP